jgi:hypothetical protein
LAHSSEAVIEALFIKPDDEIGFGELLRNKYSKYSYKSFQEIVEAALKNPRKDFVLLGKRIEYSLAKGEVEESPDEDKDENPLSKD